MLNVAFCNHLSDSLQTPVSVKRIISELRFNRYMVIFEVIRGEKGGCVSNSHYGSW